MLSHSFEPQVLNSVSGSHPLYGRDLRTFSDVHLAEGAARAILPAFGDLWARLNVGTEASAVNEAHRGERELVSSALRRLSRILVQRIRIESILPGSGSGVPSVEVSDEVLDAVTLAFVHMAGVFDALAITNGLLAGRTEYREMGWQKTKFRNDLRQYAPDAVALMSPEVAGGKLLRAVLDFRNTIHRQMPDVSFNGRAGGDPQLRELMFLLERRSHGNIFAAFEDARWTRFVGVELVGDLLFLSPATIMLLMLNDGVPVLNRLLSATPVDTLATSPPTLNPNGSLYPSQLRTYAVEYLGLEHLVQQDALP